MISGLHWSSVLERAPVPAWGTSKVTRTFVLCLVWEQKVCIFFFYAIIESAAAACVA